MLHLFTNIRLLARCPAGAAPDDLGEIENAALAVDGDRIAWVGKESELPPQFRQLDADAVHDAAGALVIPGLVDCHTHLAFGGWRDDEFELRCRGTTYLEIAQAGGGIASTVRATREVSEQQLTEKARQALDGMKALGVTTVECKSGYGLTVADELKLLHVYRRLAAEQPLRIVSTLLGAHIVPPEFQHRRPAYVQLLCDELIPQVADERLARFCDVFVEHKAFTPEEARAVLEVGKKHGLRPKLHVDQFSDSGGALLAAELNAISAEHLEYASDAGIAAMAQSDVVGVVLPIASLYVAQPPVDARRFLAAGVDVAVATDFNPGTAPSYDLHLAMMLACTMSHLTPAEALRAATIGAAKAIGMAEQVGSLEAGKQADFVLLDTTSINHFLCHFQPGVVRETYVAGQCVYRKPNP